MKVEVDCCEGIERYRGFCLRDRCPLYVKAREKVQGAWPFMATGFGNAYGNPSHGDFLNKVKEGIREKKEAPRSELCLECDGPATWVRYTQFAGDHYFCVECAKKEKGVGESFSGEIWKELPKV